MRLVSTAISLALASGMLPPAAAQEATPPLVPIAPAGPDVSGRTFGGRVIAAGVQEGAIVLRASRIWSWSEGQTPTPGDPETLTISERLLMEGDVTVTLGLYRFIAARAVVWLEQVGVAEEDPSIPVYQVAVYFDRVGDPAAQAGVTHTADRLLVTGMLGGRPTVRADRLDEQRVRPDSTFVQEAEARMARLLHSLAGDDPGAPVHPVDEPVLDPRAPITPGISRPFEPDPAPLPDEPGVPERTRLPAAGPPAPIFASGGQFTIATGDLMLVGGVEGEREAALVVLGGPAGGQIVFVYTNSLTGQMLQITAERAVVFFHEAPAAAVLNQFGPEQVRGIYLEGNVVATGRDQQGREYTLRAPRIYYDVQNDRAMAVDAVFWTFEERIGMPLYVRARALRMESENRFTAQGVRMANSAFFEPHFAIGASSITVTRTPGERTVVADAEEPGLEMVVEGDRVIADVRDLTFRFGELPFFYWPRFRGDVENIPLRGVAAENSRAAGFVLRTAWDPFGVLGIQEPDGWEARLLVDGYFERGAALGTQIRWSEPFGLGGDGSLFAYTLINDQGRDLLPPGTRIDREGDTRAIVLGDHLWRLDQHWSLQLEGAYISDETFVDAFFRDIAENRREVTNAAYLKRLEENTALTVLAQGSMHDFTPNHYLLQSQGHTVDRLPEVGYHRLSDDLLAGLAPGLVSWTQEYRFSRLSFNFVEPTARELGFPTEFLSRRALGIGPDESPGAVFRAAGFDESAVLRFDTRHELEVKADFGPLKVVPFAVGRYTGYDQSFEQIPGGTSQEHRVWGAAGVRTGTSFHRIDPGVESRLLDLHQIRHIVEPSATVWTAGSNIDQGELPIYDSAVESIATGTAVRAGVKQTWQTKRGGAGRWRSVDVLTLSTDFVFSSGDVDQESPVPRFFDYRPEYSQLGDFFTTDARWQVTDALGLVFNMIYDFDLSQPARTVVGATIDHTPDFRTFAELRYLNARDVTYFDLGAEARLTRKYTIAGWATYDADESEFRTFGGTLRRRFPVLVLGISTSYDTLTDDFRFGIVVEPLGLRQEPSPLERLRR